MFKSIFTKTLYERRWGLFWWSIAMFLFTLLIVMMFPVFRDSFGQSLQSVPEELQSVLGNANDYQRIEGFLELQVFMQMIFLTFIYGIITFTSLLAGDESSGTLQTLLAQPVSRAKVYVEKLLAGTVLLFAISTVLLAATLIGLLLIGESVSLWGLVQATLGQFLVSLVFSLSAYCLGAVTGSKGIAGGIAGVYAFVSYLLFTLAPTVDALKYPNYLSPFKYITAPRILDGGLQPYNVILLMAACLVLAAVGLAAFGKRDLQTA